MQADSWSQMKQRGDWVIEKRITQSGRVANHTLCVMGQRGEEQIQLPDDLLAVLVAGGAKVHDSHDWED